MQKRIVAMLIVFTQLFVFGADEPLLISSSLKSATIYRSGAELTHTSSITLNQGNHEVVIQGISNVVDVNSVQITCPAAVTIMGVEFSNNFLVSPEASVRINNYRDSAEAIRKSLDRVGVQIQTTLDLLEVLKANRDIKGEQTGLSVAELVKLMDYYKNKSAELQTELAAQREKQKKLTTLLDKVSKQIKEEESLNTSNAGQLKVQVNVAAYGKYDFDVSYITPNAWWTPYYDVRVDDIKSPLKIIYKAKMTQTTGIDWKKVKLSLSTSVPNQWGVMPTLRSWMLSYINPINVMNRELARNSVQSFRSYNNADKFELAESSPAIKIRGATTLSAAAKPMYIVNGAEMSESEFSKISPSAFKTVDVLKDAQATSLYGSRGVNGVIMATLKEGLEDYVSVSDNELNLSFDIELPYDVPTNGKEQTAVLKEYTINSFYKYYAVPRLDKDAYLLAEVSDWEKLNLLPGDANIIFEGTYVGKSFIDPASTVDTLNLTLGKDKRLVVKKEKLMDFSSTKFLGSNKLQKITYEITIKNNKKDAVKMLLKDQYPLSTLKEIEVELLESSGASVNTETGVLSWKLDLAPGESRKLRIGYSVKYPKEKTLNL